MNIAMIHYRVGETDGVSLEMDKWKTILEKNGHTVYYIAGSEGTSEALIVKELNYRDEFNDLLNKECYEQLNRFDEIGLKKIIEEQGKNIERQFVKLFTKYNIEIVIPNNILCLGKNPHIAMGLTNAIVKTDLKVIGHHHDFYWEREYYSKPTTPYVANMLENYFPPKDVLSMQHVVINTSAKKDLLDKKGLESTVVPNVFDFDNAPWIKDDYNNSYKNDLGLSENQILFLQATRVTNRKAIELAIDMLAVLNEPRFKSKIINRPLYNGKLFTDNTEMVLVLVGLHEGIDGYERKLIKYAKEKNVKIVVKPEWVDHERREAYDHKVYALWDAYVHCDIITYPSIYEGWGNQFLEGLFARKPQVVFEYSVFESDIKALGFDYVSLGNKYEVHDNGLAKISRSILEKSADEVIKYLTDRELYYDSVNKNFNIAKEHLSLYSLEKSLLSLLEEVEQ